MHRVHLVLASLLLALPAAASERQFTYIYTSSVLNPGDREIEPWTTVRAGREGYFFRMDNAVEVEFGLAERLQGSFYLHAKQQLADAVVNGATVRTGGTSLRGVSFAAKYKLLDPVADVVGLALYLEPYLRLGEVELEGKLIVDKRLGSLLLAANFIYEHEWKYGTPGKLDTEAKVIVVAGASWSLTDHLSLGLEARSHNVFEAGEAHTAVFTGPTVAWRGKGTWLAFTVLPQVASLTQAGLDLEDHERVEARLLMGFHL